MVEDIYEALMYLPLAATGLALITLVITVVALSTSFSAENEIFPTGTCTSAVLSVRNSTLPAFTSWIAFATSVVTVPVFGFGIRPRGPSTLPSFFHFDFLLFLSPTAKRCSEPPWFLLLNHYF